MMDEQSTDNLMSGALFAEHFRRETTEMLVSRTRWALYAACLVYPGFWFLDRVISPANATYFGLIRLAVLAGYLLTLLLYTRPIGRKFATHLSVFVVFLSAFGIELMAPYLGGFKSDYYVGIMMAMFVGGLFMPWSVAATVVCGVLIVGGYFGLNGLYGYWATAPLSEIAPPFFFMSGSFLFMTWANRDKDITRRKDLALRMRMERANEDLKALDESKTRFFSNVSHELRSPLMLILGPIEQMLSEPQRPQIRALLEAMDANARRLLRQVNTLLDFAKMDAGKLKLHYDGGNLGEVLKKLVVAAAPLAQRRGITLTIEGEENLPEALLDYGKVETIAANLISNAIKFTPEGGKIMVRAGSDANRLWFEVEDTGYGIPEDQLKSVFERFRQVDDALSRKAGGTGLGLAMVKELTELHKGRVDVTSALGKGTTFHIELPLSPDLDALDRRRQAAGRRRADQIAATRTDTMLGMYYEEKHSEKTLLSDVEASRLEIQARADGEPEQKAPADAPRLLLVEDNADLRTFVARALAKTYNVSAACDGLDGLETAKRVRPDLVITDVMMPRMDGYEFCRRLREDPAFDQVPVILATAEWGTDKLVKGVDVGANDYISKPFEMRELEARIKAHLRARFLERSLQDRDKRLNAIGRVTSAIVHDLRNPLNVVLGFAQLAREDAANRNEQDIIENLDTVISESKRLGLMVAEVLDFAKGRISELSLEQVELGPFLTSLGSLYRDKLKKSGIALAVDPGHLNELTLSLDPMRTRRVLENLVKNAEEAILETPYRRGANHVWITVTKEERAVAVRVADDGPGIAPEVANTLFEPFTTKKKAGTGLGLATAKSLMLAQGGEIAVEPKAKEGGAAFILRFPFVTPSVQAPESVETE